MSDFRLFVEKGDVFGFEELKAKKDKEEAVEKDDDEPIKPFGVQWFMDSLSRKRIGGSVRASDAFMGEVCWGGKRPGAVRARLQPNIVIYVERLIRDLEGEPVWVCKSVVKPDVRKFAGHEDTVAEDVFEEVEKVWGEALDKADEEWRGLLHLTKRMADRVQVQAPETYIFQDVKQVNDHYYVIYFTLRGGGTGKISGMLRGSASRTPEATIDLNFDKRTGLLQIILTTVTVGGKGGDDWQLDIPYLNAYYAPSQTKDEIIDSVIAAFKFF